MLRRTVLTAALTATLIVTACAPAATPAPTGGAAQPAGPTRSANQVIRAADSGLPASASPEIVTSRVYIFYAQFDSLLMFGEKFEILPGVATRWELLPDNSAWRFTLRRDMTFSNGDRLTAADVEFTINHYLTTRSPQSTLIPNVTGARAVDEFTVDLLTRTRDVSVLFNGPYLMILPKTYYERVGRDTFANQPIGSGPYELAEYRPNDLFVYRLRANYTHPFRRPIPTEIRWRGVPDPAVAIAGLRTGELDFAFGGFTPDQAEQARRDNIQIDVQLTNNQSIRFDQQAIQRNNSPLADRRVRLALNYAVDKETIARTIYRGFAQPAGQIAPPDSQMFDPAIRPVPFNQAEARRLLAEAGYPNGFRIANPIDFTQAFHSPALLLAVQDYLRQVGVEVGVENRDFNTFVDLFFGRNNRQRNEMIVGNISDNNGFFSLQRGFMTCNTAPTALIFCVPAFDQSYDAALAETDPARRQQFLRAAARAYGEEFALLFLVVVPQLTMYGPKIQGVKLTTPTFFTLDSVFRVD